MDIPEREPGPADIAAMNSFSRNLVDVNGAIAAVVEATGCSLADACEYILDNLEWQQVIAGLQALGAATGWSDQEVQAYLVANRERLAELARSLPVALNVIDVDNPQALRLAAMKAQRLADLERRRSEMGPAAADQP
jgi:hypothetical protein